MAASHESISEARLVDMDKPRLADGSVNTRRDFKITDESDIASDRRAVSEIALMADRMSLLLQATRRNNIETDDRLREIELSLLELEKYNG